MFEFFTCEVGVDERSQEFERSIGGVSRYKRTNDHSVRGEVQEQMKRKIPGQRGVVEGFGLVSLNEVRKV